MSQNHEQLFQKAYSRLSEHIRLNNIENRCSAEFSKLDNNVARVQYLLSMEGTTELFRFPPDKTDKSLSRASQLKNYGNSYFQQKKYGQALTAYNQALMLAPAVDNGNLVALCFANRSAVLFTMQKYEECLSDIETALAEGYPHEMQYKLLTRRAKCHQYTSDELSAHIQAAMSSLDISNLDEAGIQLWRADLGKLSVQKGKSVSPCPNDSFRFEESGKHKALASSASVQEDNEYGRFIHADTDISAGDVVLVEKPFCSITLSNGYLTHCFRCQKRVALTKYPCRSCADVVYCSKTCEGASWSEYHRYECSYILNIKAVDVNMGHLALRAALKAGYKMLKQVICNELEKQESCDEYMNIFKLQGHEEERSSKDLFWRTIAAVVLAEMCELELWSEPRNTDTLIVLASGTLHHMDVFPCNAHEISEIIYDEKQPCQSILVEVGAGIYRTLSMFNHSCDPSVVRTFRDGNTCIMNALSPIQKSQQIYDNYGCLYATHSLDSRQTKLSPQYYFECSCVACVQNWPLYNASSYETDPVYKCSNCMSMIVPPYGGLCDVCSAQFSQCAVEKQLQDAKRNFDKVMAQLFSSNNKRSELERNMRKLQEYSQLVNGLVFRPYKTLNDCQEALKHVYSLLGNHVSKDMAQ